MANATCKTYNMAKYSQRLNLSDEALRSLNECPKDPASCDCLQYPGKLTANPDVGGTGVSYYDQIVHSICFESFSDTETCRKRYSLVLLGLLGLWYSWWCSATSLLMIPEPTPSMTKTRIPMDKVAMRKSSAHPIRLMLKPLGG